MLTTIENWMSELGQALRRLGREWGFVVAFVVTLALGIGANGAVFTALNAYLFKPLPYPQAGQLSNVYVGFHAISIPKGILSAEAAKALAKPPGIESSGLYSGGHVGAGIAGGTVTVISNGKPTSVGAVSVTASLFKTLGVHPVLGRWINPASNRPGGPREVVVSYGFWRSALGGERNAIGKPLEIDGEQYTVVGVMPKDFTFPARTTLLWRSMVLTPMELSPARLMSFNWNMIVRRSPQVSPAALHTALNAQLERELSAIPTQDAQKMRKYKPYAGAIPLRAWFGGATGNQLLLMQLGALLLLILAAANLGNLALVRTLRRRHELGLRLALGANRLTLLRLALGETLPLGIAAAILGWILSRIGASALTHFGVASGGTAFAIGGGGSTAWLGVVLSLIVAFIALSAPMVLVRSRHLMGLLQSGGGKGAAGGRGSKRTRKGLSVVQIALAVMLLSASALVGISLHRTLNQNQGFEPGHLTVASVDPRGSAYDSYAKMIGAWRATQSAVAGLPGVRAVGVGTGVPFTSGGSQNPFRVAGRKESAQSRSILTNMTVAGVTLPKTLGLHLLHGRLLDAADAQGDAHNIVVDANFAKSLFGTTNVIGRRVESSGYVFRIVGVVSSIRNHPVHGGFNTSRGTVIVPLTKTAYFIFSSRPIDIVIRSPLPTRTVTRELKSALAQALPGQAIMKVSSMRGLIAESSRGTSALATLLIAFGILAFVLASVGTYGVVAYLTRLRRREFAIRLVLGARPGQIEWLVLAQGIGLWALGAVLGIGFAILFGRLLGGSVGGISLFSPAAYIVPAIVLGIVVALASWLPARRVRRTALAETLNPQ